MKSLFRNALVAVATIVLLASCKSKSAKQANLIPKDAMAVIVVDQEAMSEKLKKGNIQLDASIEKLFTMIDSVKGKKMFADAKNSGVDFKEKMYAFITQKGNPNTSQTSSFNLIASLTDATKFESFLKNQEELKGTEIKKEKNYTYLQLSGSVMISWTSELAMLTGFNVIQNGSYDNTTGEYKAPPPFNKVAALKALVNGFYTLKDSDKLSSVKYFSELLNEKADAYMFASSSSTINSLSMMPFQLPKLEELLKDNYSTITINFEDGKIVSNGTYHYNDRVNALMKQYGNNTIKPALLENFPAQHINAAMLLSFKPEMVGGLMKELELETLANVGLSQMGITMQDIYKCLNGNMAIAMGDFALNMDTTKGGFGFPVPALKYLFNAEVADKASLDKVMKKAVEMKLLENKNGVYTLAKTITPTMMYLRIDEKNIIVASDSNTYVQYASKTAKANINKDFANSLTGKSVAMYVDFNSLIASLEKVVGKDEHAKTVMNKALTTFNDATMTAENIVDGKLKSKGEFTFKDTKQNSLISIANFINTAVDEIKKSDAERQERYNNLENTIDSVAPMPSH